VPPGHETLPWLLMGPTRPTSGGQIPTQQPPKNPNAPLEPGSYKEAALKFKAAILNHLEEKLSLANQDHEILRRAE